MLFKNSLRLRVERSRSVSLIGNTSTASCMISCRKLPAMSRRILYACRRVLAVTFVLHGWTPQGYDCVHMLGRLQGTEVAKP